jgi:hypothetical protein
MENLYKLIKIDHKLNITTCHKVHPIFQKFQATLQMFQYQNFRSPFLLYCTIARYLKISNILEPILAGDSTTVTPASH